MSLVNFRVLLQTKSEVVKIAKSDVQVLESGRDYARKPQEGKGLRRDFPVSQFVADVLLYLFTSAP